jgi:hypothetical protein
MFPELGPANTALDATDKAYITALYGSAPANGGIGLLIQSMASFGVSAPVSQALSLAPPPMTEVALASSMPH